MAFTRSLHSSAWRTLLGQHLQLFDDRHAGGEAQVPQPSKIQGQHRQQRALGSNHDRHFAPRKRQRHQCLAIGRLAERRGILWSDTDRTIALLRHRRVVDDQHRILAADQAIGLNQQLRLQRRCIPNAISNEMVQLIIIAGANRSAIGEKICTRGARGNSRPGSRPTRTRRGRSSAPASAP